MRAYTDACGLTQPILSYVSHPTPPLQVLSGAVEAATDAAFKQAADFYEEVMAT